MQRKRAFSLIEILVAVLILGLGLLGIGALFPVVIRDQRQSLDTTMGVLAIDSAKAQLTGVSLGSLITDRKNTGVPWFLDLSNAAHAGGEFSPTFTGTMLTPLWELQEKQNGPMWEEGSSSVPGFGFGEWYVPPVRESEGSGPNYTPWPVIVGVEDGSNPEKHLSIPLTSRLYPSIGEGGGGALSEPQYVWDVALQRVPLDFSRDTEREVEEWEVDGNGNVIVDANGVPVGTGRVSRGQRVRAAIFVRRLDPRIRLTGSLSLIEALTDETAPASERRAPVAVDIDGLPTLDGTYGERPVGDLSEAYSRPITIGVEFREYLSSQNASTEPPVRDRLYFRSATYAKPMYDDRVRLASQIGQKLVDNLGNIYTVIESGEEGGRRYVRVDPPVPTTLTRTMADGNPVTVNGDKYDDALVQVVFTPQIPAAVLVTEVK